MFAAQRISLTFMRCDPKTMRRNTESFRTPPVLRVPMFPGGPGSEKGRNKPPEPQSAGVTAGGAGLTLRASLIHYKPNSVRMRASVRPCAPATSVSPATALDCDIRFSFSVSCFILRTRKVVRTRSATGPNV